MKNAAFYALVLVVAVILALIGYGIYLSLAEASSGIDVVGAVCTGAILVIVLVAWEYLMKPGYYRRRGREEPAEPEDERGSH